MYTVLIQNVTFYKLIEFLSCLKVHVFLCCVHSLFTEEEIQSIKETTYYHVLLTVTSAQSEDIQKNAFIWLNGEHKSITYYFCNPSLWIITRHFNYCFFFTGDPCPQPQPLTASDLQPCTKATSMSYFGKSSKAGYGIVVIILFFFPVGQCSWSCFYPCVCINLVYIQVHLEHIYRRSFLSLNLKQWVSLPLT